MGCCHRGAGAAAQARRGVIPGAHDVGARCPNIEAGAEAGSSDLGEIPFEATNDNYVGHARGGVATGIVSPVAGGCNHVNASVDGCLDGGVQGTAATAGEAHVGDCEIARLMLVDHPIDAFDDVGGGPGIGAVEDTDRHDGGLFGHAVGGPADESGRDRAVTGAVVGAGKCVNCRVPGSDAIAEFDMRRIDTGVEYVNDDATARSVIGVSVVMGRRSLVDEIETPRGPVAVVVHEDLLREGLHPGREKDADCEYRGHGDQMCGDRFATGGGNSHHHKWYVMSWSVQECDQKLVGNGASARSCERAK